MKLFEAIDAIKNSKLVGDIKAHIQEELANAKVELQEGFKEMKSDLKKEIEAIKEGSIDSIHEKKEEGHVESANSFNVSQKEYSLQEAMNELVGLSVLKKALIEFEEFAVFKRKAALENKTIPSSNMHMMFLGNPGTGKTVVARKMAKFLYNCGLIQEEKVIEVSRKDLVGGYVGQTAIETDKRIQEALGGILFVDEAYTLYSESDNDYGREAVETIMKAMEDYKDQLIVIFAGYEYAMKKFESMNEGISSRIGFKFVFDDYSPDELIQMFTKKLQANGFTVDQGCNPKLYELFAFYRQDPYFGNGRFVDKVIQQTMMQRARRRNGDIGTILVEDIPNKIL